MVSFFEKLKSEVEVESPEPEKTKNIKELKEKKEPKPEDRNISPDKEAGQLSIDVYETKEDFVIQSTIAGVSAEDLDISIENSLVVIKGSRQKQDGDKDKKYFYQECYWGPFSRRVILPEEVDGSKIKATMKDGVLTLRIPKIEKKRKRKISVKTED